MLDQRGEKNPSAKLTWENVEAIKALLRSGEKQLYIAVLFGVGKTTISDIKRGRRWAC